MRNLAIFIALVFLTSCAQVPKESGYLLIYQNKMQASEHWNQLAKKVADDVESKIGYDNEKGPIFMSDVDRSPFGKAMRTFLATELNHRNLVLTAVEASPYQLVLEVQKVFHAAAFRRNTYGGLLSFLFLDVPQTILLGETDLYRTKPHSEIIVTYELLKNGLSLLRDNGIFYVNDADRNHYWESPQIKLAATLDLVNHNYNMTNNY